MHASPPTLFTALLVHLLFPCVATAQGLAVDSDRDELYAVDLATGAAALIGSTANNGLATPADLAYRSDTRELWTIDLAGGELGTIDLQTAAFTPVHATGSSGWQGLAWSPKRRLFYASNQTGGVTHTIDPITGQLAPLGASGVGYLSAMEFDADDNLWGIVFSNGAIVKIDLATGIATRVATTRGSFSDLGFAEDGTAYAHNSGTDSLYTIDLATGVETLVGSTGTVFVKGFDVVETGIMRAGVGCNDSSGTRLRMMWSGAAAAGQTLQLGVAGVVVVPVVLLFGVDNPSIDLGLIGAPGCSLQVSTEIVAPPTLIGAFSSIPVANQASVVGLVLYVQGIAIDAAANAFGLVTSDHVQLVGTR